MLDINRIIGDAHEYRAMMGEPVTIHLNPADLATLTADDRQKIAAIPAGLRPDPDATPGAVSIGH